MIYSFEYFLRSLTAKPLRALRIFSFFGIRTPMKYVSLIPLGYFTGQADDPEKSKLYQQLNTIKDNLPQSMVFLLIRSLSCRISKKIAFFAFFAPSRLNFSNRKTARELSRWVKGVDYGPIAASVYATLSWQRSKREITWRIRRDSC